jgi:hypothetical protein
LGCRQKPLHFFAESHKGHHRSQWLAYPAYTVDERMIYFMVDPASILEDAQPFKEWLSLAEMILG